MKKRNLLMSYEPEYQNPSILVAQLGARMNYAVPRALWNNGSLNRLETDISLGSITKNTIASLSRAASIPSLNRLADRSAEGIPTSLIRSQPLLGVSYATKLRMAKSERDKEETHVHFNTKFQARVIKRGLGNATGVYVFNGAGGLLMSHAKENGIRTFLEQTMGAKRIEKKILEREANLFPDWSTSKASPSEGAELSLIEEEEWQSAEVILCGSEFVKESIVKCGGPGERCMIVPYGVNTLATRLQYTPRTIPIGRKLRVLTVGAFGLRKGAQYLLPAARELRAIADFRWVGPSTVHSGIINNIKHSIDYVGLVPRSKVCEHYDWADIFLLPSLWEGSATVTYEAATRGLPIICTRETGSLVIDGKTGIVIESGSTAQIVDALLEFVDRSSEFYEAVSTPTVQNRLSERAYSKRLIEVLAG